MELLLSEIISLSNRSLEKQFSLIIMDYFFNSKLMQSYTTENIH